MSTTYLLLVQNGSNVRVVSPIDMCKPKSNGTIVVYIAFYFANFSFEKKKKRKMIRYSKNHT